MLADKVQVDDLREKYLAGGYGYGQAKKELLGLILELFATKRQCFQTYMQDVSGIEQQLAIGEAKARNLAAKMLRKVREKLGYVPI
jgi:tryptophanyl-tRNA synthetase